MQYASKNFRSPFAREIPAATVPFPSIDATPRRSRGSSRDQYVDDTGISFRVKQFIADQVDSVMQLEMLLLVRQTDEYWTPAELAGQLRIDPEWVESQLRIMVAGGLVVTSGESPAQFRYEPRTPELAATVDELSRAYADRRVTVIGMIFSKPTDKIRSFADAFRIRKERPDG